MALVRESQARQVEDVVIRAARAGQLTDRVDERRVIQILEQLSEQQHSTKITVRDSHGLPIVGGVGTSKDEAGRSCLGKGGGEGETSR